MEVKGGMGWFSPKSWDFLSLLELHFHCSSWEFGCQQNNPSLV